MSKIIEWWNYYWQMDIGKVFDFIFSDNMFKIVLLLVPILIVVSILYELHEIKKKKIGEER